MSRHFYPIAVTTSLFVAASLSGGEAIAQRGRPGAPAAPHPALAAPHFAAPAPHFAAPAPHFAAPHMAASPHFAAPARSFAPHAASPHVAPRSAPHPNLARVERGHIEHGHGAPQPGRVASEASRRIGATHAAR